MTVILAFVAAASWVVTLAVMVHFSRAVDRLDRAYETKLEELCQEHHDELALANEDFDTMIAANVRAQTTTVQVDAWGEWTAEDKLPEGRYFVIAHAEPDSTSAAQVNVHVDARTVN